ncbi:MAG: hypothetical protein NZ521_04765 [Flammeovirgaceae bacterium]|nr:hypothetical protein [Flammeovirgaceae bacterium]MDW8287531.1 hypothetical protein [Flammeovirgaceae bacterium]
MKNAEEHIECPKCRWQPDGGEYWRCDKCHFIWNTFATYGKCPSCGHVHKKTQCPACTVISPHVDWYVDLPNVSLEEEEEVVEKAKY